MQPEYYPNKNYIYYGVTLEFEYTIFFVLMFVLFQIKLLAFRWSHDGSPEFDILPYTTSIIISLVAILTKRKVYY